jgi:hypothetical protein
VSTRERPKYAKPPCVYNLRTPIIINYVKIMRAKMRLPNSDSAPSDNFLAPTLGVDPADNQTLLVKGVFVSREVFLGK